MNKSEFIVCIKNKLNNYPSEEVDKAISFYTESIDDRVEDGMSEEEAVASLGNIDDIVKNIQSDMPINAIFKNKIDDRKSKANNNIWWIVLIAVLTCPIWLTVILGVLGTVLAVLGTIFGLGVAFVAVFVALCIAGFGIIVYCIFNSVVLPVGVVLLALGMILIGVGLVIPVTKGVIWLFKKIIEGIKWCYKKIKMALV